MEETQIQVEEKPEKMSKKMSMKDKIAAKKKLVES